MTVHGVARLRAAAWLVFAGLALYFVAPAAIGPAVADLSVAESAGAATSIVNRPAIVRDAARVAEAEVQRLKAVDGPEPDALALAADAGMRLASPAGAGVAAALAVRLAGRDLGPSHARGPPAVLA